ncbi:MAG: hypothetical protein AB7K37_03380 [Cyclobacteriaceae bacterium]
MNNIPKVLFLVSAFASTCTYGQLKNFGRSIDAPGPVVCYALQKDQHTFVPPPPEFVKSRQNHAKTKTANIEVQYVNFTPEAQTAFQAAVDIWESLIQSDVTIRIRASWQPMGTGVLGSATPATYRLNTEGAQRRGVWYPIALAEKIVGEDLNDAANPDILAFFNSSFGSWYFGTDGLTPSGNFDFVTIVLHEIGHGLGLTHAYTVEGNVGTISDFFGSFPVVFESFAENASSTNLLTGFTAPSSALQTQLTSNALFFNGPHLISANGSRAKIYAPSTYSSGSSIAHLDETEYPAGTPNSLMTPQIGFAESAHNPGPIVMGILKDIGWTRTLLKHEALSNTESIDVPFDVTMELVSDDPVQENTIALRYRTAGESAFASVNMTATGQPNEYQATIPAPGTAKVYEYYVGVRDNLQIERTNPGKNYQQGQPVSQHVFRFEAGPDHKPSKILHEPIPFLRDGDQTLGVHAIVSDNIGVQSVIIEWLVNDVAQAPVTMTLTTSEDSLYSATLNFPGPLATNDVVKYKIVATDNSMAQNVGQFPLSGYTELKAEGLAETQDSYANDFDAPSGDFFGNGFSITTASGFSNGAIHTNHPYSEGNGFPDDELNFVYQLRIPIRVKESGATIRFDEIVLVEPGENNAIFGSSDFYDYVVTEASKDGGNTWLNIGNGYDSRDFEPWLTKYNSSLDGNISTAVGDPSLYRPRELNLLQKFSPDDVVIIRFRLFSDPFAAGWGWAIDKLRIQIDETGPNLLHNQIDYILSNGALLPINIKVTDDSRVETMTIKYFINSETEETYEFVINEFVDQYSLDLDLSQLSPGDELSYQIIAADEFSNESRLPATGYFRASYLDLSTTITSYFSTFDESANDFSGSLFEVKTPPSFSNGVFSTSHE